MKRYLTMKEAADRLGDHPDYLLRPLRRGVVHGHKGHNYRWQISEREVKRVKSLQRERGRYYPHSFEIPRGARSVG
jgi:hypothetical protein